MIEMTLTGATAKPGITSTPGAGQMRQILTPGDARRALKFRYECRWVGIEWVARRSLMLLVSPCYHWRNSPTTLRKPCRGHLPGTKGADSLLLPLGTEVRMTLRHVYAEPRQSRGGLRPRPKTNAQNPLAAFPQKNGLGGLPRTVAPSKPSTFALRLG